MLNKRLAITGLTVFAMGIALTPSFTQAQHVITPESGHVEVMLSGSVGLSQGSGMLDSFISLARQQDFLSSPSIASVSPLAPCALLSAATTSSVMNMLFAGISQSSSINIIPPQGTHIFGKYDAEIRRSKGKMPSDNLNKAADMIARLVILNSWAISTKLNTLITPLNQQQCLELLLDPSKFDSALSGLHPSQAVQTHIAPVSSYISAYRREDGNTLLEELLQPNFLDRKAGAHTNPLAPCSLLRAFRLAARINDVWHNKLTKGAIDVTGRPELAPYLEDFKDGKTLNAPTAHAAEVTSAVFAAEIVRANEITTQLTNNATERDCLEEILMPGTLRIRLMKDGIMLPLH